MFLCQPPFLAAIMDRIIQNGRRDVTNSRGNSRDSQIPIGIAVSGSRDW